LGLKGLVVVVVVKSPGCNPDYTMYATFADGIAFSSGSKIILNE
jgi:hypothetical protein